MSIEYDMSEVELVTVCVMADSILARQSTVAVHRASIYNYAVYYFILATIP